MNMKDIKGRCSCCGKPNSKFDYIGVRVKITKIILIIYV